jgi:uncharacterized membrane protein
MKNKLFLLVFVLMGAFHATVVSVVAARNGFEWLGVVAPYAGIVVGTTGGFLIGALGLRMYTRRDTRHFIEAANARAAQYRATMCEGYELDQCQTMYRKPYVDRGVAAR